MKLRHGFTLIEAMIALFIMALIAGISFSGLDILGQTDQRLEAERARMSGAILFFLRLEHDLANCAQVQWRQGPSVMPPLQGGKERISFVRLGDYAPGQVPQPPRRVGYAMAGGGIEYMVWPTLDIPEPVEPESWQAMEVASDFKLEYLDQEGQWREQWSEAYLPSAVKAAVTFNNSETLWRIFDLPSRS